jgi:Ni/Co efflux regulator RcnB
MKKVILALFAAAFTLGAVAPAQADYYYRHHHRYHRRHHHHYYRCRNVRIHHHWVRRCY